MKIDLTNLAICRHENFKGGEKHLDAAMFNDDKVRIIRGTLEKGASIGYHTHETNCEVIYILSGKAKVLMDDQVEYLEAGQCNYCPKGHSHSLMNDCDEPLIFIGVIPEQ